jgi:signal transduction histidine kinase
MDIGWHRSLDELVSDQPQSPQLLPRSNTQLPQPHRHLRQLLAEAAHDVRAPIAVAQQILASVVDRIRSGANLTSADQGMLTEASHRLTQAQHWAEGILTERRLEHGQPANIRRRFYPHQWLVEHQPVLNSLAAQHRVQLVWIGWDRSLPRLYLDPTHLSRVVLNLVTNAIRASQPGNQVEIQVAWLTNVTQHFQITVQDSGCGLPVELLRQINANQLWPANTSGVEAGGMGLRTVKALARAMGGTLSARAVPAGGTQFCLSLPVDNYHSLIRGWIRQNIDLTPMEQRHWPHQIAIYALRGSRPTPPAPATPPLDCPSAQLDAQLQRAASVKDLVYRVAHDRWLWLTMAACGPADLRALGAQTASSNSTPASLSKVLRVG